jgi:hypothetical protein
VWGPHVRHLQPRAAPILPDRGRPPHPDASPASRASSPPPIARRRIHSPTPPPSLSRNASTRPPHRAPLAINGSRPLYSRPTAMPAVPLPSLPYIRAAPSPAPLAPLLLLSSLTQCRRRRSATRRRPSPPDLLLRRGSLPSGPWVSFLASSSSIWCFSRSFWRTGAPVGLLRRAAAVAAA